MDGDDEATKTSKKRSQQFSLSDEREPVIVHYDIRLDDAQLDPYQFRVYARIVRRCAGSKGGQCFETWQSMADACQMSRAALARALKVLIERRFIAAESSPGNPTNYKLLDKSNWVEFDDWQATLDAYPSLTETGNPSLTETGGVSHRDGGCLSQRRDPSLTETRKIINKNTKKENKIKTTERSTRSAENPLVILRNSLFEIFREFYESPAGYGQPYNKTKQDFVHLSALIRRYKGELSAELFLQAVKNYFRSEITNRTLADLSVRFAVFTKYVTDRFKQDKRGDKNGSCDQSVDDASSQGSLFGAEVL